MPLPLENSAVRPAGKSKVRPRRSPPEPTVVLVDDQRCLKIPLTKGKFALITESDQWVCKWLWMADGKNRYASRSAYPNGKHGKIVSLKMHREILKPSVGMEVDHINGNGFDNRRCNLREVTKSQNQRWSGKHCISSSRFKGVTWNKKNSKWVAQIHTPPRSRYIGLFEDETEAAKAYDRVALELYGEFAKINFP